jgi:3-methyladenine DNA glycosylase AlkD
MPVKTTKSATGRAKTARKPPSKPAGAEGSAIEDQVGFVLASLEQMKTRRDFENLTRFGITANKAFGVSMTNMQRLAKRVGRNHDLAAALWDTGWYEARMMTSFVDEPSRVTPAQMDRWCRDFDNWAVPDTLCFYLFDRTPHAWGKVEQWSRKRDEYQKRAAFALLASLALHDKGGNNAPFVEGLALIERAAADERNFVKKGVSWALRAVGRRNAALNAKAVTLARRLSESPEAGARWIGKESLRELTSPAVARQLARKTRA